MYEPQNELSQQQQPVYYSEPAVTQEQVAGYLAKVMGWMCVGLLTTLVTAFAFATVESLFYMLFTTNLLFGVIIAQFVVVIALSAMVNKVSAPVATVLFMVYAALTGATLSIFFLAYELTSLLLVFGLTSFIFLSMSVYGAVTKKDLTRMGSLCFFGLLGIILGGLVNMFLGNGIVDLAITSIGILIFIGLTAYDTQRIKGFYIGAMEAGHSDESSIVRKAAIIGALSLYLDFINLFLKLLRLLGKRK